MPQPTSVEPSPRARSPHQGNEPNTSRRLKPLTTSSALNVPNVLPDSR